MSVGRIATGATAVVSEDAGSIPSEVAGSVFVAGTLRTKAPDPAARAREAKSLRAEPFCFLRSQENFSGQDRKKTVVLERKYFPTKNTHPRRPSINNTQGFAQAFKWPKISTQL